MNSGSDQFTCVVVMRIVLHNFSEFLVGSKNIENISSIMALYQMVYNIVQKMHIEVHVCY